MSLSYYPVACLGHPFQAAGRSPIGSQTTSRASSDTRRRTCRPGYICLSRRTSQVKTATDLASHFSGFPNGMPPPGLYHRILKEIEVPLLTAALAATRGNQIRAADLLGLNRNTLRKKIRDLDIQVYRSGG